MGFSIKFVGTYQNLGCIIQKLAEVRYGIQKLADVRYGSVRGSFRKVHVLVRTVIRNRKKMVKKSKRPAPSFFFNRLVLLTEVHYEACV